MLVELVLLIILIAAASRGWKQGLIESLGELVGAIIAFMVARAASPFVGSALAGFMPGREGLARFIAFVLIALLVAKLVGMLFGLADKILHIVTRLPFINLVQSAIGGILGFLAGIVLIGSTTYLVLFYRLDATLMGWLGGSMIARWCEAAFSTVLRFML